MKKEIITNQKIKFKEKLTVAEDQMFLCAYLACCSNCFVIRSPLYCYDIERPSSATHTLNNNRMISNRLLEMDARDEIIFKHPNLEQYCQGTVVLTAVEMCYMCAQQHTFRTFVTFCKKDLVRRSLKALKLKNARFRMLVAFLPLKLHLYLIIYLICKLCILFKVDVSPD